MARLPWSDITYVKSKKAELIKKESKVVVTSGTGWLRKNRRDVV